MHYHHQARGHDRKPGRDRESGERLVLDRAEERHRLSGKRGHEREAEQPEDGEDRDPCEARHAGREALEHVQVSGLRALGERCENADYQRPRQAAEKSDSTLPPIASGDSAARPSTVIPPGTIARYAATLRRSVMRSTTTPA